MSTDRYAAFLRAIAHVPMEPFRSALAELGFAEVRSFGMSGNFVFHSDDNDTKRLEELIGRQFETAVMVRSGSDVARIVNRNPFDGPTASIVFLSRVPSATARRKFAAIEFEGTGAVMVGRSIYFSYPLVKRGRKGHTDIERELGVVGTARAMSVIRRIADLSAG